MNFCITSKLVSLISLVSIFGRVSTFYVYSRNLRLVDLTLGKSRLSSSLFSFTDGNNADDEPSISTPDNATEKISKTTENSSIDNIILSKIELCFPTITIIQSKKLDETDDYNAFSVAEDACTLQTLQLDEHKPLGCTAEESLVVNRNGMKHVFISKIVEGGNAEKCGLQIGDVIVGVSGSFDDIVEVVGDGLDKVRNLIAGRNSEDTLILKIIRGTDVMAEHETTLVEQCMLEDEGKAENIEKCIEALYEADYKIDDKEEVIACDDSDIECMLDQMYNIWDEVNKNGEYTEKEESEEKTNKKKQKPAPWSSRSSPSGTFIRDPKTGKMRNIDE